MMQSCLGRKHQFAVGHGSLHLQEAAARVLPGVWDKPWLFNES